MLSYDGDSLTRETIESSNNLKLHKRRLRWDIKKKVFTERVSKPWNRLPREAMIPGITVPGNVQKPVRWVVQGHGLRVDLAVLDYWLDLILEDITNHIVSMKFRLQLEINIGGQFENDILGCVFLLRNNVLCLRFIK